MQTILSFSEYYAMYRPVKDTFQDYKSMKLPSSLLVECSASFSIEVLIVECTASLSVKVLAVKCAASLSVEVLAL